MLHHTSLFQNDGAALSLGLVRDWSIYRGCRASRPVGRSVYMVRLQKMVCGMELKEERRKKKHIPHTLEQLAAREIARAAHVHEVWQCTRSKVHTAYTYFTHTHAYMLRLYFGTALQSSPCTFHLSHLRSNMRAHLR